MSNFTTVRKGYKYMSTDRAKIRKGEKENTRRLSERRRIIRDKISRSDNKPSDGAIGILDTKYLNFDGDIVRIMTIGRK